MRTPRTGGDPFRPQRREPPINLPPVVLAALGVLFAVFLLQEFVLGYATNMMVWQEFGFIPARYVHALGSRDLAWLWSPLTYSLLHGGWSHIIFNAIWLAIFGAPVAKRLGPLRFLLLWVTSAAASAFFFALTDWGAVTVLIGASGVVSAYMGAACRFVFAGGRFLPQAHLGPRLSIGAVFADPTARAFVLVWLVGNLLVAVGVSFVGVSAADIAWQAHVGGFLFGFLAFPLFDVKTPRTLIF
ncbi:rhomboid family intramembrane serine protease [Martelella lutilitoris]|uniref:Rhomboid family intramembrane serine protease n=1 Tax=Martelella lutilitoris TaxID=2583532 RepID=A0A7T7HI56_9HYPH|nr:rhomboid family intramembrane serine protease [Martelella lutilitoris]QQM29577.1 rhomboid family intramembrane serine protease [Martelella lutilitoris]